MHLIAVHDSAGASNPLGVPGYYDRIPFAPYYLFKVRRCTHVCRLCKRQRHFPNMPQTPGLGSWWKSLLNIACLEKVQIAYKQLYAILGSVKIDMVRAILLKVQTPALSKVGGGQFSWNGSSYKYIRSTFKGSNKGKFIMRYVKNIIKALNVQPKSMYSFYNKRTTVSTKGSNSYVGGGPIIAGRWNGPVYIQSMWLSTGTGRTTNVLSRLDSLHSRAKQNTDTKIDRKIYRDFMLNKDMYLSAYQRLRSRPGMMTPGIDPTTLDGLSTKVIEDIINKLSSGEFQFTPGRRVLIPKADGKSRPLTIGNPRDKLVQEVMRMVLEVIYEPVFKDVSHGFRPNKGCHTALRTIFTKFVGCTWWIEGDIKACFDSIPHDKLMLLLSKRILDQRFLELIRKALKAGYLQSGTRETDIVGTPQGSVISPILANIFLHELDTYIEQLKLEFDAPKTGYRPRTKISNQYRYLLSKAKLLRDPVERSREIRKYTSLLRSVTNKSIGTHSKKLMYVRYADDWIIAINGSYSDTVNILQKVREFCAHLGLTVSIEKTKITNAYKDKVLFLGTYIRHALVHTYSVRQGILQRNRRGILLLAPLDRIKTKLTKAGFLSNDRAQTRITWVPLTARQIVHLGNQVLRGYLNYYSFVHNRGKFVAWLYWTIKDVVVRTLARKFKVTTRALVYKKFGKDLTIYDSTKRDKSNRPRLVAKLLRPNYRMNVWDFKGGKTNTIVSSLYSNNASLANLDSLFCTICKSKHRVEMHHVRMMKDLKPNINRLDFLMIRANRKQTPLCRRCHMKYHGGNLDISVEPEE